MYIPGAASQRKYDLQATYEDNLPGTQQASLMTMFLATPSHIARQYYCSGNAMEGVFVQNSSQVGTVNKGDASVACYAQVSISPAPTYTYFVSTPFMPNPLSDMTTATEAYKRVMSDVGAWPVDNQDTRIVQETLGRFRT